MQGFRFAARRVLLTFPQVGDCGDLYLIMGFHLAYLPPTEYYLVSRENHEDGGVHYHLVIVFKDEYRTRDPRSFDWMFNEHHGNIKPIKSGTKNTERAIVYVKKDDNYVEDGIPPIAPPKVATMVRISKLILEGKSLQEINVLEHPAMVMHAPKVRASIALTFPPKSVVLKPWVPPLYSQSLQQGTDQDIAVFKIKVWLAENIRVDRDYRQPHLWIWGPGSIGKSRLLFQLHSMLKVFDAPDENKEQMTGYTDDYDLIAFDDYHHSKSITFLKKFLQAYPMKVAQKTIGPYDKRKHTPCLFTSNKHPKDAYNLVSFADPAHFNPLLDRLLVINVLQVFNLFP